MGSSLLLKGGTSTPKSIVETFSQANTFVAGDAVRYDIPSSTWVKAQADSAENSEVAGVVSSADANSFDLTYSGYISVAALSGISAPVLFLDSTAAGGLTASPPSAIGTVIKPVLTKTTNGSGYIVTNYLGTQIGGSSTVAIDEIQPVGTVVPFAGSVIPDSWLECNGASYAVSAYPYLYSKLQYSSGDRAPAYGYVANITVGNSTAYAVGQVVSQTATGLSGTVLAHTTLGPNQTNTLTVQVIPTYNSTTKNFVQPNAVFSNAAVTIDSIASTISAVSVTHFNTPDLRGRFAIGANTSRLPANNDLEADGTNNSAISGIYSLGSEGGQESTIAGTGITFGNNTGISSYVTSASASGGLIANIPPYTVVRYIIKASPYTRAAIIDGIDIPYTSLLVGDLRDGSLRPGGSGEALVFKTNDGTSGTERMRLTDIGLGIATGTSTLGATLDVAGSIRSRATTASTSTSTGALVVEGGAGIAGALYVGGITTAGGITMGGALTVGGVARVNSAAVSNSTATGALIVTGGAGIAGALYVGGITTAGGITMGGALTVGGAAKINNGTASTSTAIGALTVVGGVGIGGALCVGGGISAGSGITIGSARLAAPSGTAPVFGARAWAVANWSGSAISLGNAGNIASVTYIGDRKFTFTFTSNMPTADYVVNVNGQRLQVSSTLENLATVVTARTVSSFTVGVEARNGDQIIDSQTTRLTSLQVAVFC